MMNLYEISVPLASGGEKILEEYKGKVLLIVNTASKCGFTPQFKDLEDIYLKYKDKGLVVLGFPCDQFLNQEFDNNEEIQNFCQINYGVSFPVFAKIKVKGKNAHPLFKHLTENSSGFLNSSIKWNFTKFLINKEGEVVSRYAPTTNPESIIPDIEQLL